MNIYPSEKAKPYVYMGTNYITKEFYIGYRERNAKLDIPSHLDIQKYKTSSPKIKQQFSSFHWLIIAEFEYGSDAYDFEQKLIWQNWHNPLLLNESCHYEKRRFKGKGGLNLPETRAKISATLMGHSTPLKGSTIPMERKLKISKSLKGRPSPTKGKIFPNRKKTATPNRAKTWRIYDTKTQEEKIIVNLKKWIISNNLPYTSIWRSIRNGKKFKQYEISIAI